MAITMMILFFVDCWDCHTIRSLHILLLLCSVFFHTKTYHHFSPPQGEQILIKTKSQVVVIFMKLNGSTFSKRQLPLLVSFRVTMMIFASSPSVTVWFSNYMPHVCGGTPPCHQKIVFHIRSVAPWWRTARINGERTHPRCVAKAQQAQPNIARGASTMIFYPHISRRLCKEEISRTKETNDICL